MDRNYNQFKVIEKLFIHGLETGDLDIIQFALDQGVKDINRPVFVELLKNNKIKDTDTLLSAFDILLSAGFGIDARDENRRSALFYTKPETLEFFKTHGADFSIKDKDGCNALDYNFIEGNTQVSGRLHKIGLTLSPEIVKGKFGGCSVECFKNGEQQLYYHAVTAGANADHEGVITRHAISEGKTKLLKFLYINGVDLNAPSIVYKNINLTPLQFNCNIGGINALETLIELGADVNDTSSVRPAIMIASDNCHPTLVDFILGHGFNPNLTYLSPNTHKPTTILMDAIDQSDYDLAFELIERGADPFQTFKIDDRATDSFVLSSKKVYNPYDENYTFPLLELASACEIENSLFVEILEANKDQLDVNKLTALALEYFAGYYCHKNFISLLEYGVNPDSLVKATPIEYGSKELYGPTFLSNAIERKNELMVSILVSHGANVNRTPKHMEEPSYSQLLADNYYPEVAEILFNAGLDPNLVNSHFSHPTSKLVSDQNTEGLTKFLANGSDPNGEKQSQGSRNTRDYSSQRKPLKIAYEQKVFAGNQPCALLLLYGASTDIYFSKELDKIKFKLYCRSIKSAQAKNGIKPTYENNHIFNQLGDEE